MKKIKVIRVLIFCALAILLFVLILKMFSLPLQFFAGYADEVFSGVKASIAFFVEKPGPIIFIVSPENVTYNFNIGSPYLLNLTVHSNETNLVGWRYTLYDLRHNVIVNESVPFEPNTTFYAVRWQNKLSVFVNNSKTGSSGSASVIFFVNVPNSAPAIQNLSSQIYVCENRALNVYFNVIDPDEDTLQIGISPADLIFGVYPVVSYGKTRVDANLFSILLNKKYVGNYSKDVFVIDPQGKIDTKKINITVIEVNNVPVLEGLRGSYTLYTRGEESTEIIELSINDVEGGKEFNSGNFTYNLSVLSGVKFFDFDSYGRAYLVANESLVGVHNYMFCLTDKGVPEHPNISLCTNQKASNNTICQNFSVTVTNENRAPTITSYYPFLKNFSVNGTDLIYFNITSFDPDGTIPDNYWFVDGNLVKYEHLAEFSNFTYSFGCGVSGKHIIEARVSDGLANDSVQWDINVSLVPCAVPPGAGGGGGGAAIVACAPKWICNDWGTCQNTENSLKAGVLSGEDYRDIKNLCLRDTLTESSCGFQVRDCFDLNACNVTFNLPSELQICYYTSEPSCFDGIKNCHDGLCEFLVDCGGPCPPCPTCSDRIKNQNEEGVDCGGPCPPCPPAAIPFLERRDSVKLILLILNLSLLFVILIILARILLKYIRSRLDKS